MTRTPIIDPETGEVLEEQSVSSAQDHSREEGFPTPDVMSLEEARMLLAKVHEVGMPKDDPMLMAVTLHQGFCADLAKINATHNREIKALLDATGKGYAQSVDDLFEGLQDKTVTASINNTLAMTEKFTLTTEQLRRSMHRFTWINGSLAFVSLLSAGFVVAFVKYITG